MTIEDKKQRLNELLEQKKTIIKFWFGGMLVCVMLAILYGVTKDTKYIAMSIACFVLTTVACVTLFSSVEEEEKELEEELVLEKLEKRIEKLEDEVE